MATKGIKFMDTQGPAAHKGIKGGRGGFPARAHGGGVAQTPKEVTPPTRIVPLRGK